MDPVGWQKLLQNTEESGAQHKLDVPASRKARRHARRQATTGDKVPATQDLAADANKRAAEASLRSAARAGDLADVQRLLAPGVDINAADATEGFNALLYAAEQGHNLVVRAMLEAGCAKDMQDTQFGYTALHLAAERGHSDVAGQLLRAGCQKDVQATWAGSTALHLAAEHGHKDVARLLVQAGCSTGLHDHSGQTPLDIADAAVKSLLSPLPSHLSLYLALLALVLELALLAASFFSSLPGSPSVRGGGTTMGRWGMATTSSISDVDDDEELVIKSLPEWVRRKLRGALSHQ